MNKIRFFTSLALLGLTTLLLLAQQAPIGRDEQMVGGSDFIVVGTVTAIQETALSTSADGGVRAPIPGNPKTQGVTKLITFTVDETLKGVLTTKELTVAIPVYANQNQDWLPKVAETNIFFLQRSKTGYTLAYGQQGMQQLAKIDDIDKIIKSIPIKIELPAFQKPLFFGKAVQLTVKVTNLTDSPLTLRACNLQGFYHAKRMESFLNVSAQFTDAIIDPEKPTLPATLTIAGKQTMDVKLTVTAQVPQSMALLGADSYMMTIAALYVNINYATEADKTRLYAARSNWNDAFLGFPLETEPLKAEVVADIAKVE